MHVNMHIYIIYVFKYIVNTVKYIRIFNYM